jgi:hypothetical protein
LLNGLAEPFDHADHGGAVRRHREQNAELVASQPRDRVVRAQRVVQTTGNLLQDLVPGVAERVVDLLEAWRWSRT